MVLYIAIRPDNDISSMTHLQALKEIYGAENVIRIDLRPIEKKREKNYIAYGKYKNVPERLRRWTQGNTMFISNAIINEICDIIRDRQVDVVFSEESILGNLVAKIKKRTPNVKVVCFYHDIAADLYRQRMKRGNFIAKIENGIGILQEKVNQKHCDMNLVFNKSDAERFYSYYGKEPDCAIPIASPAPIIPPEVREKKTSRESGKKILFVGAYYFPNVEGMRWFYSNVLPNLSQKVQIDIVGRGMEVLANEFPDERVNVIGMVDSLEPYYLDADIIIAPIFSGGGMKIKSVEAVSFGKCIVGTEESLHGFWEEMGADVQNKTVFRCETAKEWIDVLNTLTEQEIHKFNQNLFDVFMDKFSYEAMLISFKSVLCKNNK